MIWRCNTARGSSSRLSPPGGPTKVKAGKSIRYKIGMAKGYSSIIVLHFCLVLLIRTNSLY